VKLATLNDLDEIYKLYRTYSYYFPHVRKSKVQNYIESGGLVYDGNVIISFSIYRANVKLGQDSEGLGSVRVPKGDCMLHQIISRNQGDGSVYRVFEEFNSVIKTPIWGTVRSENIRSLRFMGKLGFSVVGGIRWGRNKQVPGVIMRKEKNA
jgi:hypothetical protein